MIVKQIKNGNYFHLSPGLKLRLAWDDMSESDSLGFELIVLAMSRLEVTILNDELDGVFDVFLRGYFIDNPTPSPQHSSIPLGQVSILQWQEESVAFESKRDFVALSIQLIRVCKSESC